MSLPSRSCVPLLAGLACSMARVLAIGSAVSVLGMTVASSALAQCDPRQHWLPAPGDASLGGIVYTLTPLPGGKILAGGEITNTGAGAVMLGNVGVWDEATHTWSALGAGVQGPVYASAVLPGGDFVVAGQFQSAGNAPAQNIARWNASTQTWSPLGNGIVTAGFAPGVYALALLPNGELVAAGSFSSAGGSPAGNIAKYNFNTGTWSTLGSGISNALLGVRSMTLLPSGDLVVGGNFSLAGGVPVAQIAMWSSATQTWSALGGGITQPSGVAMVLGVCSTPGGDVFAIGDFTTAGGNPAARIARWNGSTSTWSALGSGLNQRGWDVTSLANGDIAAVGEFTLAGGGTARRAAVWNPSSSSWSELDGGASGTVLVVRPIADGSLAVGGDFSSVGPSISFGWARTRFGVPAPSIVDQPVSTFSCAHHPIGIEVQIAGATPRTFQWRRNGVPLDSNLNPFAATSNLVIEVPVSADAGVYDCLISNACGSVLTNGAALMVCEADFNCDLVVDFFDYLDFVAAFSDSSLDADFNRDSSLDFFDYLDFVASFSVGCQGG